MSLSVSDFILLQRSHLSLSINLRSFFYIFIYVVFLTLYFAQVSEFTDCCICIFVINKQKGLSEPCFTFGSLRSLTLFLSHSLPLSQCRIYHLFQRYCCCMHLCVVTLFFSFTSFDAFMKSLDLDH